MVRSGRGAAGALQEERLPHADLRPRGGGRSASYEELYHHVLRRKDERAESGTGGNKKNVKKEAAQKIIDKLKSMGPNNGPAAVSDVTNQEVDEELLTKVSNMKVEFGRTDLLL